MYNTTNRTNGFSALGMHMRVVQAAHLHPEDPYNHRYSQFCRKEDTDTSQERFCHEK